MTQYQFQHDTPLKFHKFFWYVTLPLSFIQMLSTLISGLGNAFNWVLLINSVYCVLALGCMLTCFIGFFRWRPWAWYSVFALLGINSVYALFLAILCRTLELEMTTSFWTQLITTWIYSILIGIYYWKRRPLFFQEKPQEVFKSSGVGARLPEQR